MDAGELIIKRPRVEFQGQGDGSVVKVITVQV